MTQFPNHPDQLKEFLHKLESFTSEQIADLDLILPESWLKNPKYLDRLHLSLLEAYPNLAPKFSNLLPDLLPSLGHRLWLGWWPLLQGDWGLITTVNWLQKNSEDEALLTQFIDMVLGRKTLDSGDKSLDSQLGYLALERMLITQCEKVLPILRPTIKTSEGIKLFLKFFTNQPDVISNLIYHDILKDVLETIKNPPASEWDIELSLELVTLAIPYLSQKLQSQLVPLLHILIQFSYAPMFTILYEIIPLNLIEIVKDRNHISQIEQKLGFEGQDETNKGKKPTGSRSLKALLLQHNIHPNSLDMEWEEELLQLDAVSQQDPTSIVTHALLKYNTPPEVLLDQNLKSSPHYESLPFYVYHLIHHLRRNHLDHLPASVREGDHHQVFTQLKSLQQENKSLKEKLERNLVETQNRQSNHVKWENELNSKLKNFREQVRELKTKLQSAETELQSIKQINPENENISTGLNPEIELTRLNDLEDENIKLKDKVSELVKTMVEWKTQYEDNLPVTELLSEAN